MSTTMSDTMSIILLVMFIVVLPGLCFIGFHYWWKADNKRLDEEVKREIKKSDEKYNENRT
jgi:hypothetical protein